MLKRHPRPHVLIAAGLLGMGLYYVAMRLPHPGFMVTDMFQGLWYGICLGLELLGLYSFRRPSPCKAA